MAIGKEEEKRFFLQNYLKKQSLFLLWGIHMTETRKEDHITLTEKSQMNLSTRDDRFLYEPLLGAFTDCDLSCSFLGKKILAPLWISSMSGGSEKAQKLNITYATAAKKYGLGMGLGSLRPLLESDKYFSHFHMRPHIGHALPLLGNIGIAQAEFLCREKQWQKFEELLERLELDGFFLHMNPLQEYYQPEGDRYQNSPLDTLDTVLKKTKFPVMVKEVGQGMGPASLKALSQRPIAGIELAAFGGTNFAYLEHLRAENKDPCLARVGHGPQEMIEWLNELKRGMEKAFFVIVSGGIRNFLDGHYYTEKLDYPCIYAQAQKIMTQAVVGDDSLDNYLSEQIEGLKMAKRFLKIVGD